MYQDEKEEEQGGRANWELCGFSFSFPFFLALPHSLWDLSSPTSSEPPSIVPPLSRV